MKILLFGAIWCKECKLMRPLWRNLKLEFPEIKMEFIEYDDYPERIKKHSIKDVPTAVFLNSQDKEMNRVQGLQHKDTIIDLINKYKNL